LKNEGNEIYFVEVTNPNYVRRNILESIKDIVEGLQRFEKFKDTRKDKINNINKLDKILKEINKVIPSLKNSMPETKLRAITKKQPPEKKETSVNKKVIFAGEKKKEPVGELQKLEDELSEIEGKLQGLR